MEPRGQQQWKGVPTRQGHRQPPIIFSLAGFVQSPAVSAQQVREQKDALIAMIRELGGSVIEKDEWDPRVTHVVAHVDGKKESMSEKVMAALAGGRWVVTRRFVDRSYRQGVWLPSPKAFVINDAVLRHRLNVIQAGAQGGAFWGFRAALLLSDPRKNGVYSRVITAGGGVLLETTLEELVASPPSPASLTHLFIDPWAVGRGDPRAPLLHKLRMSCPQLWMLFYKFLFMKVRHNQDADGSTSLIIMVFRCGSIPHQGSRSTVCLSLGSRSKERRIDLPGWLNMRGAKCNKHKRQGARGRRQVREGRC